jgi:endo-1,4-beta-xylanase
MAGWILLPAAFGQATPLTDATALKPGSISGRLVYADNNLPAAEATLELAPNQGAARRATVSAPDGRYELSPVPAGTHALLIKPRDGAPVRVVDIVVRPGQAVFLDTLPLGRLPPDARSHAPAARIVDGGRLALFFPYKHWTVTGPILSAGPAGSFDELAVKNPSLVFHRGRWHLFYTSKPRRDSREFKTALGYITAPTLEALAASPRIEMRQVLGESIISPQVFYFEPQGLWYLIGHVGDTALQTLEPVYSTNPDIENVNGWTAPRKLRTSRRQKDDFWIDFWVICDEQKAHLFYSNHKGTLHRMETPLADFPGGFAAATEQLALTLPATEGGRGKWMFYDASHIYHVKSANKYLAILEGASTHPTRRNQLDGRNRFLFGMIANRLEGPWRRVEMTGNEFMGETRWLFDEAGAPMRPGPVSHPELIRAGHDQRLQIEDYRLKMIFQTFDAKGIEHTYDYHALPWQLMLMRND